MEGENTIKDSAGPTNWECGVVIYGNAADKEKLVLGGKFFNAHSLIVFSLFHMFWSDDILNNFR